MNTNRTGSPRAGWIPAVALAMAAVWPQAFGATLTVTNLADSGPGTLRDRIAAAAPGDVITFGVLGTVVLNSQLTISKDLYIYGYGGGLVKVSGNNSNRVLNVTSGSVLLLNLAISDGRVVGTNGPSGINGGNVRGGGILVANGASLQLLGCIVSNNVARAGQAGAGAFGGNGFGGGIGNLGTLTLNSCLVVSNYAFGGSGGAVNGGGQAWGGGLYTEGSASIPGTTIHANIATGGPGGGGLGGGAGGGIYNAGTLSITASTIVSNAAASLGPDFGGAIDNNGTLTVRDSTIVGKQADFGGGITGGHIGNTILAGNSAGTGPDGSGTIFSSDYNLIQNTSGITFTGTTNHNITGQDPLLGPLRYNDGPLSSFQLFSMAPLPGSPAIDKGKTLNGTDQPSFHRPYDTLIPNAPGGNGADIGAIEINPSTLIVINTNDGGARSLRQALSDNSGLGGSNTIAFSNMVTGTITLSSAELTVAAPAIISGPGASLLAVSANHIGRVFTVLAGPTQISGLTIRDGLVIGVAGLQGQNGSDGRGGGIFNQDSLTLSNCVVRSNSVVGGTGGEGYLGSVGNGGRGLGGGIYNAGGNLFLIDCSFEGNSSVGGAGGNAINGSAGFAGNGLGGAICTIAGTNLLTACSLMNGLPMGGQGGVATGSGSSGIGGQGYGGGLYSESTVNFINSTVGGNNATAGAGGSGPGGAGGPGGGVGGGVYNVSDLTFTNCTIANNKATGSSFDSGSGIHNNGTLMIFNSTIAGNQADFGGGLDGNATASNTILAGNTATSSGSDGSGTITSFDYNLIQTLGGLNIVGATAHTLVGLDPILGPLADNGGPTFTRALLSGSPAIDQGKPFGFTTDQRGVTRPYDLPSITNAGGGDGSDIGAFEFLPTPRLNIQRANNKNVLLFWSTDAADFHLQGVTTLPTANNWIEVTNTRAFVGNQVYVTNSAAGASEFYRLSFPSGNR